MSQAQLLSISESIKTNTEKLQRIERPITDITREVVNKDIQMIQSETGKINKFAGGIKTILDKVKDYKLTAQNTVVELNRQSSDLKQKITVYEKQFAASNKQKQFKRQIEQNQKIYVSQWQKRIQIANQVDVKSLNKVQIQDRKSKAHEVFKWIIVSIYGEPDAKYYLPNFKEQVFEKEQGRDFKERLGKINASVAKQQAKIKTIDFLQNYAQISSCSELISVKSQVQKIKKVAEIFLKCYDISKKIKQLQVSIQKSLQQSRQKDQQAMRWKAKKDALQDRIKTNNEYLACLEKIESKLNGKAESYKEKEIMANEVVGKLKRQQNIPELQLNIENDKRDNCECRIF